MLNKKFNPISNFSNQNKKSIPVYSEVLSALTETKCLEIQDILSICQYWISFCPEAVGSCAYIKLGSIESILSDRYCRGCIQWINCCNKGLDCINTVFIIRRK